MLAPNTGIVFIVLLSGQANVLAPFFGSAALEFVRSFAMSWIPDAWQTILGAVMLLVGCLPNKGRSLDCRSQRCHERR